ncbi:MAG: cytochrome c biogenesis protein CcsA [Gammaproteobacteria bacterium]|nr:cytochrome c biogenesis protein CcsA [Gammaproteobacteria bacterium]
MNAYLTVISIVAIVLYLASGGLLGARLVKGAAITAAKPAAKYKASLLGLGLIAVLLHGIVLYHLLVTDAGLNLGFFNAISLLLWFIALLLLLASIKSPVENIGIVLLPLAALALALEIFLPSDHVISSDMALGLGIHILTSLLAYAVLSLASVQAILVAIQHKHLHNRHPGGFVRALPPLETMESLLFQMITVGIAFLSVSLFSGFVSLDDMFAQDKVHKTVFAIIAWLVFAILLWGRWQYGWRGRIAIRWTLVGFVALLLAYIGSKLVQELVLGR